MGLHSACQHGPRLEFSLLPDGALGYLPIATVGLSHLPPLQLSIQNKPGSNGQIMRRPFVRHRGLAISRMGSRSWKENQVAQIPDSTVLGFIIYLETKKHCLPGAVFFIATIFHLLYFTTRPQGGREAQLRGAISHPTLTVAAPFSPAGSESAARGEKCV